MCCIDRLNPPPEAVGRVIFKRSFSRCQLRLMRHSRPQALYSPSGSVALVAQAYVASLLVTLTSQGFDYVRAQSANNLLTVHG